MGIITGPYVPLITGPYVPVITGLCVPVRTGSREDSAHRRPQEQGQARWGIYETWEEHRKPENG